MKTPEKEKTSTVSSQTEQEPKNTPKTPPTPTNTIVPEYAAMPSVINDETTARQAIFFRESSGRLNAVNGLSGACGLGQSLPCTKLMQPCPDWQSDQACQEKFFDGYVKNRYGNWMNAYAFWQKNKWY